MLTDILLIVSAYLIGSISSAIIVCSLLGLPDPRTVGSRNPGATNVMRQAGKKAAIITLLGDLFKGLFPVLIAKLLGVSLTIQLLVAMAAFLGHLYPLYFRLKGGKGVATAMGILLGLNWQVALVAIAIWFLAFAIKRISSLSALTTTALAPVYIWLITQSKEFLIFGLCLTALVFWRHRSNIQNLIAGTEP